MCGIAGILHFRGGVAEPGAIRSMTNEMAHRGPDSDGFFCEDEIALGHRRLSIIDLSTAANQPFTDNSGRYVMVFNGEIYNYEAVKRQITGYHFHTTSDTEVLLAAYIKLGPACLSLLRGMYAFAIWDKQEKELFVARDRLGVKPLYYLLDQDRFLFASELRAILRVRGKSPAINTRALLDYLSYQSVMGTGSIVSGIDQLEAATFIKIRQGRIVEKVKYWDLTDAAMANEYGDVTRIRSRIRELMLQSVSRRLVSDVPVGAFLSGGIDSSAVVGLMAEASPARPNTFNIFFEEKEYDESQYADIIAKKFNTVHTKILLKPTVFLDELTNALNAMDTPSGDGINTYVVSKAIRQSGMTVALSGVGGDELFAGYPFFAQFQTIQRNKWLWGFPRGVRSRVGALLPGSPGRKRRLSQLLGMPSPSIEDAYPVFRQMLSPETQRELTSLSGTGLSSTSLYGELKEGRGQLVRLPILSQITAAEYMGYTQHTLLKDTDQMSMAMSLEVREPFFDQDLVEYVAGIPDKIKQPTYPKSLLVESLKPMLPDEIVFRKKQGFLFPWDVWIRNELFSFCEKNIDNFSQRSFVNGSKLRNYWKAFIAGDSSIRWADIWIFVVLEYWLEKNGIS